MLKPVAALSAVVMVLVGHLAGCASSPPAPPSVNVTGRWTGQCFGCQATGITLVLSQNGDNVTGAAVAAGRHAFGDSQKPIVDGKVSGRSVSFQVRGDPGDFFTANMDVTPDGKTMEGAGDYRGRFGLKFKRVAE